MTTRRKFLSHGALAAGAAPLAAPAVRAQSAPIKWRMQTSKTRAVIRRRMIATRVEIAAPMTELSTRLAQP